MGNVDFFVYLADAAGGQGLNLEIGDKTKEILPSTQIVSDAWYHLVITWKEDSNPEVLWYVNRVRGAINYGSIDLQDSPTHAVVGDNGSIYLGNNQAGNGAFEEIIPAMTGTHYKGRLDQVAFWNRQLTQTEVYKQFNALPPAWLAPNVMPANFNWNLLLPVNDAGGFPGAPHETEHSELNSGFKYLDPTWTKKYFYRGDGGTMVFETPFNGAHSDTGGPRSELRETLSDGTQYNWKPYDAGSGFGTHTLHGTCQVGSGNGKVIIGQIHAKAPPYPSPSSTDGIAAITLYYEGFGSVNKKIRIAVYFNPQGTTPVGQPKGDLHQDLVSNVLLNDQIDYKLELVGTAGTPGTVTLTVTGKINPGTPSERSFTQRIVNMTSGDYSGWGNSDVNFYFKAGSYYPGFASGGTATVTFSGLSATHQ